MGFSLSDLDPTNPDSAVRSGTRYIDPTNPSGFREDLSRLDPTKMTQAEKDALARQEAEAQRLRQAASDLKFTPYNVTTAAGGTKIDPTTGMVTAELSPQMATLQNLFASRATPGGYNLPPELQNIFSQITGTSTSTGLTQGQQQARDSLSSLGLGMLQQGDLSNIARPSTDIKALASEQYQNLKGMLAPQQEQERLALEERLFAQGMLGSTGGSQRFEALSKAQGQQDLALQNQAVRQAMEAAGLDINRFQAETGAAGQAFQQGLAATGAGLNLEEISRLAPQQRLGMLSQIASSAGGLEQLKSALAGMTDENARANLISSLGLANAPLQGGAFALDVGNQGLQLESIRQGMLSQAAAISMGAAQARADRAAANQMLPWQIGTQVGTAAIMA